MFTWCSPRSRRARRNSRQRTNGPGDTPGLTGVKAIWRQNCYAPPNEKEPFGFRDGISHPAIEGSGIPGTNPGSNRSRPVSSSWDIPTKFSDPRIPQPEILGRNGTYFAFRKLHQRVAAFRQYLKTNATGPGDEELLAAKIVGRWRSGAPSGARPLHDDPDLGADRA